MSRNRDAQNLFLFLNLKFKTCENHRSLKVPFGDLWLLDTVSHGFDCIFGFMVFPVLCPRTNSCHQCFARTSARSFRTRSSHAMAGRLLLRCWQGAMIGNLTMNSMAWTAVDWFQTLTSTFQIIRRWKSIIAGALSEGLTLDSIICLKNFLSTYSLDGESQKVWLLFMLGAASSSWGFATLWHSVRWLMGPGGDFWRNLAWGKNTHIRFLFKTVSHDMVLFAEGQSPMP